MSIISHKIKSNLKKRVIPVILFLNYQIVKSRRFEDHRIFGNLEQTISVFNHRNVDEIVILDIGASKQGGGVNTGALEILSRNSTMPIAYGGGIQTLDEIERCLSAGCDKVVINSECIKNPEFIHKASKAFGAQCIVASVDYIAQGQGDWKVFSHSGLNAEHLKLEDFIIQLVEMGAGELLITSVDHEGAMEGYDEVILNKIASKINIPILINGGCGHPRHMVEVLKLGAAGSCAGSIFYYSEFGYKDIKKYLFSHGINIRQIEPLLDIEDC